MSKTNEYLTDLLWLAAEKFPERIAVRDEFHAYSYRELYEASRQTAKKLQAMGVLPGNRVGLLTQKDTFSLLCFWSIIYSGGIPLLLDEEEEFAVNKGKLQTAAPSHIILNKTSEAEAAQWGDFNLITASQLREGELPVGSSAVDYAEVIDEVCYMLTTSGTTGIPKVIQISHRNILHYTRACYKTIGSPEHISAAHVTNLATDLGLTNIMMALPAGGMVRLFSTVEAKDPEVFKSVIKDERINFIKTTPSHIDALLPFFSAQEGIFIQYMILGGEKLSWSLAEKIKEQGACGSLFNHYGPSETTVGALVYLIGEYVGQSGSVSIGKPIGEGTAYLVNVKDDAGELYIEGPGVSKGYFNNEKETQEKFFYNEESKQYGYRTGDICVRLGTGDFIFLNRNDRQIKIKGYRIELAEIEVTINGHEQVDYSQISTFDKGGNTAIEVYVKPVKNSGLDDKQLTQWLKSRLPDYKIPEKIYVSDSTPFRANGKIDFNALRSATVQERSALPEHVNWSNWEMSVRHCWKEVLGEVYERQHFFESGGDSLCAIKFIGKLQMFGFDTSLFDLNGSPVLEDFSALNKGKRLLLQDTNKNKDSRWLTCSQFDFFRAGHETPDRYTQSVLFNIEGNLDINVLSKAIEETIKTHNELHQSFLRVGNDVYNQTSNRLAPVLKVYHLDSGRPISSQLLQITGDIKDDISLDRGIVFQSGIIVNDSGQNFFFLACHHIVVDAVSWNIILDEILTRYDHIRQGSVQGMLKEGLRNQFYNCLKRNMLPDLPVPEGISKRIIRLHVPQQSAAPEVAVVTIPFNLELSIALRNSEKVLKNDRLNSVLLSCFLASLFELYSLAELSVDIEFHGRPQLDNAVDLSRSVSWWSTTFPVDFNIENITSKRIGDYLTPIAEFANLINAYPELYNKSRYLKSDLRFNYLGEFPESFRSSSFQLVPSSIPIAASRSEEQNREYKLFLTARFIGDEFSVDIQYCKGLVPLMDVYRLAGLFNQKLIQSTGNSSFCRQGPIYQSNISSVGKPLYRIKSVHQPEMKVKHVFVTGATGFLGAHIVYELLLEGCTVSCLVRAESYHTASSKLSDTLEYYFPGEKVSINEYLNVVVGDLTQEYFGMDHPTYLKLCHSVDSVIHSAADVNLTKSYEKLRCTNIFGTKQILEFAVSGRQKEVHYVSTLAVSGAVAGEERTFSEEDFDIGQWFLSEYEKSKFNAEMLVRNKISEGLNAKIYRFGHIAANSVSAKFQINSGENRIIQLLKGILYLKKVPHSYNERISFSHVDIIAKMMSGIVTGKVSTPATCIHLENTNQYSIRDIVSKMEWMGFENEFVSDEKFRSEIIDFYGSEQEVKCVSAFNVWVNRYISHKRNIRYESIWSNNLFGEYGLVFPPLSQEWLRKLIAEILHNEHRKDSNLSLVLGK